MFCVRPYVVRFLRIEISQSLRILYSSVCGSVSTCKDITVRVCSVFGLYVVRFLRVKISQSLRILCSSVCGSVSTYRDITVRACSVFVRMWFGFYM